MSMESIGVVVMRYKDFLILLIPTPLLYLLFLAAVFLLFCSFKKKFFVLVPVLFCNLCNHFLCSI